MRCLIEVAVRRDGTGRLAPCRSLPVSRSRLRLPMVQTTSRKRMPNRSSRCSSKTCGKCHGKMPTDNDLDLTSFGSAQAILAQPKMLSDVAERLRGGDMPPKDAPQPSQAEREQLLGWITAALDAEAAARAGDPGPVTLRRLSNTEYDNAIRDLTGVDMRPTQAREFPVDSVGGEGFANVGDAMPVTPELVERYHQAARDVAARAVLLPKRFSILPLSGPADLDRRNAEIAPQFPRSLCRTQRRAAAGDAPRGDLEAPRQVHQWRRRRHRCGGRRGKAQCHLPGGTLGGAQRQDGLACRKPMPRRSSGPRKRPWRKPRSNDDRRLSNRPRRPSSPSGLRRNVSSRSRKSRKGARFPSSSKVSVERGELLLLTVLPNENHGADSTLVEWTIRETTGDQRTWSVADLVPNLLKGNPWSDKHEARWSFLETTSTPVFLTERRDSNAGRPELKSWSLGSEPSVFVNSAAEPIAGLDDVARTIGLRASGTETTRGDRLDESDCWRVVGRGPRRRCSPERW